MRVSSSDNSSITTDKNKRFAEWILRIGDGEESAEAKEGEAEKSWIKIPQEYIVNGDKEPIKAIVDATYPLFMNNKEDVEYLKDRAILAPRNDTVDSINDYMMKIMSGKTEKFYSSDSISKGTDNVKDQEVLYPTEFLNALRFSGVPNHELTLKKNVPVILLRNINPDKGLVNGTRLIITRTSKYVVEGTIITGSRMGEKTLIPRIILSGTETKWPFVLKRRQFPLKVSYAMTINKSQGQTLKHVGIYLRELVFSHG